MRSRIFALLLCLALVTSGASAMGMPPQGDGGSVGSRLVDLVWAFVQELLGPKIDPWGVPENTGGQPGSEDGSDLGPEIDPWGDEGNTSRSDGAAGSDIGMEIDPWG